MGAARVTALRRSYAEAEAGEVFAIEGSSGYIEISAREASAATLTGACAGARVEVEYLAHG